MIPIGVNLTAIGVDFELVEGVGSGSRARGFRGAMVLGPLHVARQEG